MNKFNIIYLHSSLYSLLNNIKNIMKSIYIIFLVLILSLINTTPTHAKEYYVSNLGNDSNAGTIEQPWATLNIIRYSTQPGDTVYLHKNSTWHEHLSIPASGITIDSYGSGQLPRIDNSGSYLTISAYGKSNITIKNLHLIGAKNDCIRIKAEGKSIHNINITNNIISGCNVNAINIFASNTDIDTKNIPYDIHISNNQISDCGNAAVFIRAQADKGKNFISNNVIDNVGFLHPTNAISLHYVHGIIVEHNIITNTKSNNIDGSGITADHLDDYVGSGSIIRHNVITCPTPPVNEVQAGIAVWYQPNVKIYGNTISNCLEGIRISGEPSVNYEIRDNTVDVIKRGMSFTSKAPTGLLSNNTITGHGTNNVGIYANKSSQLPKSINNKIQGFQTEVFDGNASSSTMKNKYIKSDSHYEAP